MNTERSIYTTKIDKSNKPTTLEKLPKTYATRVYTPDATKNIIVGSLNAFESIFDGRRAMVIAATSAVLQMIEPRALP